jgi:hypothetical protein
MPIKPIDYSKSVIYKIQAIHDDNLLYIGSTTDFTRRKSEHKKRCKKSKQKVYVMIRENGGWNCFNMIVVKEFPCENKRQLEQEEDCVMREMKSTLNTHRAYLTEEEHKAQHTKAQKEYYATHQEQILKYKKEYRATHKEQILKKSKEYYETHQEQLKQKAKENYIKKKQEEEAQQILEELWLCREREIIRNISTARDMDYDSLMAEFGSKK